MKKVSLTFLMCTAITFIGCKNENNESEVDDVSETEMMMEEETEQEVTETLTVTIEPKSGSNVSGNVVFTEENGEVSMTAVIDGLAEGMHAIHLHENADCSAEDGSSAGGHWNPTNEQHGEWGDAGGYHKGDIGNFQVDGNGNGTITMKTDQWCIGCEDESKNIIGKAVIVHDGVDDYTSQPSGAAGTRVGCGTITQ